MQVTERRLGSLPALTIAAAASGILIVYWHAIGFSTFVSDPANYWIDSLYWKDPFNTLHVAGFPLLIALVRGATFDVVPPATLMTTITIVALLTGVHGTYRLAGTVGLTRRTSLAAATAFGVWPFVGTVYAAFPIADAIVLALMVWAAVFACRRHAVPTGLLLGLAAIVHKGLWPAITLIVVGSFFWDRGRHGRRFGTIVTSLALTPAVSLWIAGIAAGHSVSWLVAGSASDGIDPLTHNSLPIFDGLLGSVLYGDSIGRARVAVVVPVLALALVILLDNYRRWREPFAFVASAFALQIIGLALIMSQHLVWSSVRFSGLLAVPAAVLVARRVDAMPHQRWRAIAVTTTVALVGSQLLTAWEGSSRGWLGTL